MSSVLVGGALRVARRWALRIPAAAIVIVLFGMVGSASAAKAKSKAGRICADRALVRESPGGLVIGVLEHGTFVRVIRRSGNRIWVKVSVNLPAEGWIKDTALCGH